MSKEMLIFLRERLLCGQRLHLMEGLKDIENLRGTRVVDNGSIVISTLEEISYPVASGVALCGIMESRERSFIWNLSGSDKVWIFADSCGFQRTGLPELDPGVALYSKCLVAQTVKLIVGKVSWMFPFFHLFHILYS